MVYQVARIVRDVRIAMDENTTSDGLISEEDIDTLALEEIVRSKIEEAACSVLVVAPVHLIDGGLPLGDAVHWRDQGCGWILLPDNFMRLLIFRMSDWERPVYNAITEMDPVYKQQFSRYKGLRGNPQKPVVAVTRRAEGLALELFSCKDKNATIEQGMYLPYPRIDKDEGINIPERCYRSVIYETASLALATLGHGDLSSIMSELSKQLLV